MNVEAGAGSGTIPLILLFVAVVGLVALGIRRLVYPNTAIKRFMGRPIGTQNVPGFFWWPRWPSFLFDLVWMPGGQLKVEIQVEDINVKGILAKAKVVVFYEIPTIDHEDLNLAIGVSDPAEVRRFQAKFANSDPESAIADLVSAKAEQVGRRFEPKDLGTEEAYNAFAREVQKILRAQKWGIKFSVQVTEFVSMGYAQAQERLLKEQVNIQTQEARAEGFIRSSKSVRDELGEEAMMAFIARETVRDMPARSSVNVFGRGGILGAVGTLFEDRVEEARDRVQDRRTTPRSRRSSTSARSKKR